MVRIGLITIIVSCLANAGVIILEHIKENGKEVQGSSALGGFTIEDLKANDYKIGMKVKKDAK